MSLLFANFSLCLQVLSCRKHEKLSTQPTSTISWVLKGPKAERRNFKVWAALINVLVALPLSTADLHGMCKESQWVEWFKRWCFDTSICLSILLPAKICGFGISRHRSEARYPDNLKASISEHKYCTGPVGRERRVGRVSFDCEYNMVHDTELEALSEEIWLLR